MSFFNCLYQLIIGPLKLIFEFIFVKVYNIVGNPGIAIIFLSLAMNILVLPLYRRADKMQEDVRDQEKSLEPWVSHIKKTFSGNERMMMLSTYYRQRGYKPIYALKGSFSLLLEIPFFFAAYGFLSELKILNGAKLGPISDLGKPDGLINCFGISINLLPILMTVINIIAAAIYLKGFPLKSKIQMYGVAVVFLILLYGSPAGLVFYWTLNNLFSLGKNIFYRLNNPKKVLRIGLSVIGLLLLAFVIIRPLNSTRHQIFVIMGALALQLPIIVAFVKRFFPGRIKAPNLPNATKTDFLNFVLCCAFTTVLTGVLIPSSVINDSTSEFISVRSDLSPIWFIVSAFLYAAGLFLIWFSIFYYLASPKLKKIFSYLAFVISILSLVNYLFFGTNYGNLSSTLVYDTEPAIAKTEMLINCLVVLLILALSFVLFKFKRTLKAINVVSGILCVAVICMSVMNVIGISENLKTNAKYTEDIENSDSPVIPLSTKGKNVVVIMMDRAIGNYVPYLMNEKPELKKQFSGFTYYPNTLTYGANTNLALPEVFGGYEYTPEESNKRADVPLVQKHDEALRLMPSIFSDEGYNTTIFNPTYAGYVEEMDLSIFDDIKNVHAYRTRGKLQTGLEQIDDVIAEETKKTQMRNFFGYSLFKASPLLMQNQLYSSGTYNSSQVIERSVSSQVISGLSKATGLSDIYLDNHSVMENLSKITRITDDKDNNFFMMCNDLTHTPTLLQTPEYKPSLEVDNTGYDSENLAKHSDLTNEDLYIDTAVQITHYHVNMEAFLSLGVWFDYLRDNNVYDNTKIVLVSDHGYHTGFEKFKYGDDEWDDVSRYNPVLLVKDFNSKEFTVDNQFMTNADVPTIVFENLIDNPTNPATGNSVNSKYKSESDIFEIVNTDKWQISENDKYLFSINKKTKVTINDDLLNPEYWESVQ